MVVVSVSPPPKPLITTASTVATFTCVTPCTPVKLAASGAVGAKPMVSVTARPPAVRPPLTITTSLPAVGSPPLTVMAVKLNGVTVFFKFTTSFPPPALINNAALRANSIDS